MEVRYYRHGPGKSLTTDEVVRHPDIDAALSNLESEQAEIVLIYDSRLVQHDLPPPPSNLEEWDLMHAGLLMGGDRVFHSLWLASTSWFFLNPCPDQRCVSWKATPAFCWVRPGMVRLLGGFDRAYQTPTSRMMDLAYRLLLAGGRVCHDPSILPEGWPSAATLDVPVVDELLFIYRHSGFAAMLYASIWLAFLTKKPGFVITSLKRALKAGRSVPSPRGAKSDQGKFRLISPAKRAHVSTISAIIPTLERYDYLPGAIESLLGQSPAPDEIIVIDQTPVERRRPELIEPFLDRGVRVIYLEETGQSFARNAGVQAAKGGWCFFFDDDSVAWDEMIAHHVYLVEQSGASASTGVSLASWKTREHIPESIRRYSLADVLDTGNSLIEKDALISVGGFDRAFDHGSGADHDLGVRLYLAGFEILFNPQAIRTHHKAPSGGLRIFGAWWREKSATWAPYPPATQIYTIRRFYPPAYRLPLYLLYYLRAYRRYTPLEFIALWLLLPWKFTRALSEAGRLSYHPIGK